MAANYGITKRNQEELDNNFTYHSPHGDQTLRYPMIRNKAKDFAKTILRRTPASREQSLALTKLEEVVFWANAAIARNETIVEVEVPDEVVIK